MADLPSIKEVSGILRDLLGRPVSVKDNRAKVEGSALWARYSSDDGQDEAIWMWDISPGISAGAALTMLPPEQVKQDIRRRQVDTMALENFQEVANVLGSLLNHSGKHPLLLREVGFDDVKKSSMADKAKELKIKASYVIDVEGYAGGPTELRRTG